MTRDEGRDDARDDRRGPGDEETIGELNGEPIGAPALPPWTGEVRGRAADGVTGLLRTPGAQWAATALLVVVAVQLVIAGPWAPVRLSVAGATIHVAQLLLAAIPMLLALTLFLATPPRLLPGSPAGRPGLVTGLLAALCLTAVGALLPGVFYPFWQWAAIGIPLIVQVALIVAFAQASDVFLAGTPTGGTPTGAPAAAPPSGATVISEPAIDAPLIGTAPHPGRRVPTAAIAAYAAIGIAVAVAAILAVPDVGGGAWWALLELVEYALVATMAVLAWGVDRLAGVGGTLYVVGQALSTAHIHLFALPAPSTWIPIVLPLITWAYVLALTLITAGALRRALGTGRTLRTQ
ncbi:hypothetical protein [Myceligenerans pegani]|uniref:Integral membrane protein n=1 Tax=Myceligenerans pegani TaxID=2776917 RepID=A0ABR9MX56_9MICO|nr:hypothetical protein [Myceligenerans sp. TRM 65318]MBE1875958.1 hypothetical protein [Myceligenerans sp. TRM 65318]MBE3018229.1 hypothetical protein [Myceligenerans sp. TRM 65318]